MLKYCHIRGINMGLKKRLSTLVMVTTTALTMPQVNASQNLKTETNSRNVSQQLVRQNNEIEKKSIDKTSEFLKKLKKGETIEYQGIKFDAQKLRSAQKNKQLSNFDFVIHDN